MIDEYTSRIEDIIATYSKSPSKLQIELKKFLDSTQDSILLDEPPFGDEKLAQIVQDVKEGKPLDAAYVQAIDFSEGDTSDYKDQEEAHESVAKKADDALGNSEINFRKLLIEPMFISDWPVHKHEMVGHFVVPQIEADEIVESGRISELCDPVTVSLIQKINEEMPIPSVPAGLNYGELEKYFMEHPSEFFETLDTLKEIQGPDLDDYLNFTGTTLEPSIVRGLIEHPEQLPPRMQVQVEGLLGPTSALAEIIDIKRDFAETDKGRAWKATLAARKITKNASEYTEDQIQEAQKLLKESMGVENTDSDRYPMGISYSQFSEALLQTGEIEGNERFIAPEYKEVYEEMKSKGAITPVKIDTEHPLTREDGLVIVMIGKTPEERIGRLNDIKGRLTTPGDFMNLYNFCVRNFDASDDTAAINLASSLSQNEAISFMNPKDERNSDKMEIPQGMRPDRNQNHKIRG